MPDANGYPTEAELRGQSAPDLASLFAGLAGPSRADLAARDAAARAGNGTITIGGRTFTGEQFRTSTDPAVVAVRNQMLASGRSDPNLLFGSEGGRQQSEAERQYR